MMKVGSSIVCNTQNTRKRKLSYSDVHYEKDKWVDASKFLPADFDLVHMKCSDHEKTISGWSVGKNWSGLYLKDDEQVLYWKRHEPI